MRPNAAPILLSLILPLALSACGGTVGLAVAGLTATTFASTEKLPADHVASWITGEDCSALEAERTGQYCRSEAEIAAAALANSPAVAMPVYCYRTLGEVACQSEPQPGEESRLVQ